MSILRTTKRVLCAGAFVTASALFAQAYAGDAALQAETAAQHAGFAAGSDGIDSVRAHMHHALNCLVGPDGDGFDGSFGYPCDGMGGGAITDGGSEMQADYTQAAEYLRNGLLADAVDIDMAKSNAVAAQDTLMNTNM